MKYIPPLEATDPEAPYVDAAPEAGIEGSPVGAKVFEQPQREIVEVIEFAGITPDENDLTQLRQAIQQLVAASAFSIPGLADHAGAAPDAAELALYTGGAHKRITVAELFTGRLSFDQVARDQIALTNLRQILNTSVSTGALVQGRQWELLTDEWGATSTNETYSAATPGYYSNPGSTQESGTTPTATGTYNSNWFDSDLTWSVDQGATVTHVGVYSTVSGSFTAAIVQQNGTTFTAKAVKTFTHPGTGWYDVALDAPYTVPVDGFTYRMGVYNGVTSAVMPNVNQLRATQSGLSTPTVGTSYTSGTSTAGACMIGRVTYQGTAQNITLMPPAPVTLAASPAYADAYFLWKDDSGSAALGTDLTVELSRDGGTSWAMATLTVLAAYDGTYSVVRARANLSGQPAGTSLTCRIKTLNTKAQRVGAPALYAE